MTVQEYRDALLAGEIVPLEDVPKLSLAEYIEIDKALEAVGKEFGLETVLVEGKYPGFLRRVPVGHRAVKKWRDSI